MAVILTGTMVLVIMAASMSYRKPKPPTPDVIIADSALRKLPDDPAAAGRELRKAQKAFSKLKPNGPYIVVDTHANFAYLRTEDSVIFKARCSTGSGGELMDSTTGKKWVFKTPHGVFKVKSRLSDPWWRKPDWAFIEENEPIPKNPADRFDNNVMGDYAMGFGDGFFIHGTLYERLLGINVTHGCVRLGADDLKYVWERTKIGTPVYIF